MDLSHPVWLFIHVISAILSLKVAQTVAANVIQEIPLKSEVISLLVDKHNYLRRGIEDAANMRKLDWRSNLARIAQRVSNGCDAKPIQNRGSVTFDTVGVNSFVLPTAKTFTGSDAKKAVDEWFTGDLCYKYGRQGGTNVCTPVPDFCTSCDAFTQVIWAETCEIGCAATACSRIDNSDTPSAGVLFTCVYGPGGNINGQYAYQKGRQCATCSDSCEVGLCVLYRCDKTVNDSVIFPDATTPLSPSHIETLPTTTSLTTEPKRVPSNICIDYSSLCSFWSRAGECGKNRKYMFATCPASCNCCRNKLTLNKGCKNRHPQCQTWASQGECLTNSDYMEFYCAAACQLCQLSSSPSLSLTRRHPHPPFN